MTIQNAPERHAPGAFIHCLLLLLYLKEFGMTTRSIRAQSSRTSSSTANRSWYSDRS